MSVPRRLAAQALVALALLATLAGCGASSSEPATPARISGDAATLQFGLQTELGSGTMAKATAEAVREALVNAGFRLGEADDADVILVLEVSDVDAPQFIQMTVNGKQIKKRAVTAVMKAVNKKDGATLVPEKHHKFKVTDGEEVEDSDVRGLVGQFTADGDLNRFALEVQIERAQHKVGNSKKSEPEDDAPKP